MKISIQVIFIFIKKILKLYLSLVVNRTLLFYSRDTIKKLYTIYKNATIHPTRLLSRSTISFGFVDIRTASFGLRDKSADAISKARACSGRYAFSAKTFKNVPRRNWERRRTCEGCGPFSQAFCKTVQRRSLVSGEMT